MALTVKDLQAIIRAVEFELQKTIGTKADNGIVISLREDSQSLLLESIVAAINDRLCLAPPDSSMNKSDQMQH